MLSNSSSAIRIRHEGLLRIILRSRRTFVATLWLLGGSQFLRGKYPRKRIDWFLNVFFADVDLETGQLGRASWQRILSGLGGASADEAFGSGFYRHMREYLASDKERRSYFAELARSFLLNEIHRELLPKDRRVTAVTVDVTQRCNITCTHCFANSGPTKTKTLDTEKAIDFIREAVDRGGCRFIAILGGEPLLETNRIIQIAEAFPFMPIVVFTNGSLVTDKTLAKLKERRNLSFFVSMEGFRELTDDIRVSRSFDWADKALDSLRRSGLVYGVSVTANKLNYREIVSDDFVRYLEDKGCMFTWIFDYKPLGRAAASEKMSGLPVGEEEREHINQAVATINKRARFVFINTEADPALIGGCPAHRGVYVHLSCDGYVTPCIAVRYYNPKVNIDDMTYDEIMESSFLADFRSIGQGEGCPSKYHPEDFARWREGHAACELYADDNTVSLGIPARRESR
ncbi:MAG: radical SAM protein [Micrococcales bacterium]|nr:radical SAM protein [Micrococcales bacterium]